MKSSRALDSVMASNRTQRSQGGLGDARFTRIDKRTQTLASLANKNRTLQVLMRRITAGNATLADRRAFQVLLNQINTFSETASVSHMAQQIQPRASNVAVAQVPEGSGEASGTIFLLSPRSEQQGGWLTRIVQMSIVLQRRLSIWCWCPPRTKAYFLKHIRVPRPTLPLQLPPLHGNLRS